MRSVSLIVGAATALAAVTVGFAQSQTPLPPSRGPLGAPECQRGVAPTPGETTGGASLSDQLEGKIQERYGYAKDQTKKNIDDWYNTQKW